MMMFKTWGYITMAQALTFTSDSKLGHYMKIPPRPMFWCQVVATVVAGTVQLGVQAWMFTNIPDMCDANQKDRFVCPSTQVFGTASIIGGVIGPQRQYSAGQIYNKLMWFFLIGAGVPIASYFVQKRYPGSWLKYVNWPVVFTGTGLIRPRRPRTTSRGASSGSSSTTSSAGATSRGGQSTTTSSARASTRASRSRRSSSSSRCSTLRRARSA